MLPAASLVAFCVVAGCGRPDPATAQLTALNAAMARAFEAKDAAAITRHWTIDYTESALNGRTDDRTDAKQALVASMAQFKSVTVTRRVEGVQSSAMHATATVHEIERGIPAHPTGGAPWLEREVTTRQSWLKTPGGWMLERVEVQ